MGRHLFQLTGYHSSGVEHFIGNEEVGGSIPLDSTSLKSPTIFQETKHRLRINSPFTLINIQTLGALGKTSCYIHPPEGLHNYILQNTLNA